MLCTGLILLGTRFDKFYEINGTCPEGTEGAAFVNGDKYKFMTYAMAAHASACVLHWLNYLFKSLDMQVFATFFLIGKIIIFFVIMIKIQAGTDFKECADVVG